VGPHTGSARAWRAAQSIAACRVTAKEVRTDRTEALQNRSDREPVTRMVSIVPAGGPAVRGHDGPLLSYLVANAVAAEIVAVENDSQMVHLLPRTADRIEMVDRAETESRHVLLLSRLGRRLQLEMPRRAVEPLWQAIRRQFAAAVAREDLAACLIIQDLMLESMVVPLYERLALPGDLEPEAAAVAGNILGEKLAHLEIGTWRLRNMLTADGETMSDSLRWAHHRVMSALFSTAPAVESLCAEIQALRASQGRRYDAALSGLFDAAVAGPLLAALASCQATGWTATEGAACCAAASDGARAC
jgi:fatty aldehyde decarbonylase